MLGWLDERRPDVACLQETKLTDEAFEQLLGEELDSAAMSSPYTGRRVGTALRSSLVWAWRTSRAVWWARPASPTGRLARSRPPATAFGCTRCTCRTDGARTPSTTVQAGVACRAAERRSGGPGDGDGVRRHEHRAHRRRRVRPGGLHRPDSRHAARAGGARGAAGRSACATWCASVGRPSASSPTGTTAPACSTRTWACASTWCWPRPVAGRVRAAWVDRQARKGTGPSDHAPVIVDLDEAPDGDIGPMVPPPSAPRTKRGKAKIPQAP